MAAAGRQPLAGRHHHQRPGGFHGQLQHGRGLAPALDHVDVGDEHAAGDPAQQAGAQGDDQREAVDQLEHQRATPDDDGHAHAQPEDHVVQLVVGLRVLGRAGDGDDVVQAHGEIGQDDGADRGQHRGAAGDVAVRVLMRGQQLDAYPDQQQAAQGLEKRNVEQDQREGDQQHAQQHRAGRAPQDALDALPVRQVATGQRDHDGVIAAEQDVDQNDLEYGAPMERLDGLDHK
ncbi:Uncharacterised protein [Bordetella pertussis]|nr:Uncharacterised protein [Bordetella pertussis]CFN46841.1 Uncharacterised protein [Bordetella pertussis]CFN74897.1 Uncharacterised protein [Bordetella pertussis]CFO31399.1 Uncharacterised protein [Bordetella pertussis]CFO37999.1 Uncharacterised protein [Bordetella pertussis]